MNKIVKDYIDGRIAAMKEYKGSIEDDKIEGCLNYETKYGYNYCISCNNNYYLRNGNCIEKYKSIYSNDCKSSYFENGIPI